MRRFYLNRAEDESGISGTGIVAEGALLHTGVCVLSWLVEHHSLGIYPSLADLVAVHGHGGKTKVVWVDPPKCAADRSSAS